MKSPIRPLAIAISGHRLAHPGLVGRAEVVADALRELFEALQTQRPGDIELHTMLADGADQIAALEALDMRWRLKTLLPFGAALTCAIGASIDTDDDARRRALLIEATRIDSAPDRSSEPLIDDFFALVRCTDLRALAERDNYFASAWIEAASDTIAKRTFSYEASARYALVARRMLEVSDILVAVWDGASTKSIGGTGHTIMRALAGGTPVLCIAPANPEAVRLFLSAQDRSPKVTSARAAATAALALIGDK